MTEVLFYHLQNMSLENVLPPLLEKSLERGWRVVVQSTSQERAEALDAHLWTYRDDSFLPHATARAGDCARTSRSSCRQRRAIRTAPMSASWSTTLRCRRTADSYERVVLVFNGEDDEALAAARQAWKDCKSRGFEVTYWQPDERGRWQRRE